MQPAPTNIILIGMPGVGKSTIGVLLAEELQMAFMDTDIHLQIREGRKLQAIINADGLERFRQIEENAILSIAVSAHVIATGGSVVYSAPAMAHLKQNGIVCYLQLPPDQLVERLYNLGSRGIAMAPGQSIASLYRERKPLYERYADITVDCSFKKPESILDRITSLLSRFDRP